MLCPRFSRKGSGAGRGEEKGTPVKRVVVLQRGANGENLRIIIFFEGPGLGRVISPGVSGIIHRRDNRILLDLVCHEGV